MVANQKRQTSFILQAVDRVSMPFKSIRKNVLNTSDAFKQNRKALSDLQQKQKNIAGFHKSVNASKKLKAEIIEQKRAVESLSQSLKSAVKPSRAQREEYRKAQGQLTKLTFQKERLENSTKRYSTRLKESGIITKSVGNATFSLRKEEEKLTSVLKRQEMQLQRNKTARIAKSRYDKAVQNATNLGISGTIAQTTGKRILSSVASPMQEGISFEASQSKVAGKLGLKKTSEEMKRIEEMAINLGNKTTFSAQEVSAAQERLAMSGVKAKDITEDLVSGLLDISLAGGQALEDSTSLSLSVLNGFGKPLSEITDVGDILAYTANNANTNMSEMTEVFKTVGPIAGNAGVSIEETSAAINVMSSVGVKGSIAGTALKNTILGLSSPSKSAQKALRRLGVETKDQYGNLRPMQKILSEINTQTKEMGKAEKTSIFENIVGREGLAGFTALITKYKELEKAEKNVKKDAGGSSKEMGRTLANNTEGDLKLLSSAWSGFSIVLERQVRPAFRALIKGLTGTIQKITEFVKADENKNIIKSILGFGAALGGVLTVGGSLLTMFASGKIGLAMFSFAFKGFGLKALSILSFLKPAIIGVGAAIKALMLSVASGGGGLLVLGGLLTAGSLIYANWDSLKNLFLNFWKDIEPIWKPWITRIKDMFGPLLESISTVFSHFSGGEAAAVAANSPINTIVKSDKIGAGKTTNTVSAPINISVSGATNPTETAIEVKKQIDTHMKKIETNMRGRLSD